jgi:hypothetical protein
MSAARYARQKAASAFGQGQKTDRSTHRSRCYGESLEPMNPVLGPKLLRGKSGVRGLAGGLGVAGEPPDAAVTMAVSGSLSRATGMSPTRQSYIGSALGIHSRSLDFVPRLFLAEGT